MLLYCYIMCYYCCHYYFHKITTTFFIYYNMLLLGFIPIRMIQNPIAPAVRPGGGRPGLALCGRLPGLAVHCHEWAVPGGADGLLVDDEDLFMGFEFKKGFEVARTRDFHGSWMGLIPWYSRWYLGTCLRWINRAGGPGWQVLRGTFSHAPLSQEPQRSRDGHCSWPRFWSRNVGKIPLIFIGFYRVL